MSAIRLTNVSKSFKQRRVVHSYTTFKSFFTDLYKKKQKVKRETSFHALKDISYVIKEGNVLGIIGLNGSGKSTLLKCIAGIYKVDQGKIDVNGRISTLIELGAGFHPEFTGRENVIINGIILGLSKREIKKRYDGIVKYAELEEFIDNPIRTYSSGMYMRLGFSVAVNVDPDILLIDEILSVGDESFAHKCKDKISDFKRQDKTIVIVSHDLSSIEKWCDEVIWLDKGIIKLAGQPRRVIDAYRENITQIEEQRFKEEHEILEGELHSNHLTEEVKPVEQKQDIPVPEIEDQGESNEEEEQEEDKDKQRWGTKEIEIYSVKFLNKNKEERYVYDQGEPMTINIQYKVNKMMENLVFGIGIFRPDGICCYGTNTHIEKIKIPTPNNDGGDVFFEIECLDFMEGTYFLDVAVHSEDDHPYDYQSRLHSFAVRSKINDVGIFRLKHKWVIN